MTVSSDRDAFIAGCVQLANTPTGVTALQANNTLGPQVPNWQMRGDGSVVLSWWDLFVLWHYVTMELPTQSRGSNRAHGGPVFLPWHRLFLLRLEQRLQTVLGDANFALPYWDWARDRQLGSALWNAGRLGRNRGQVTSGVIGGLRVRLTGRFSTATGRFLEAHQPLPISRAAGLDPKALSSPPRTRLLPVFKQASTTTPAGTSTQSMGCGTASKAGRRTRLACTTGCTSGSVATWVPAHHPTTPSSTSTTAMWTASGKPGWSAWRAAPMPPTAAPPIAAQRATTSTIPWWIGDSLTPAQVLDPGSLYDYDNLQVEQ